MNTKEFGQHNGFGFNPLVQIPIIDILKLMSVPATLKWYNHSLN